MNAHTNIPTTAAKAAALAQAAADWALEAERNDRSLACWRAEYQVLLAIGDMGLDDVQTAIADLGSIIADQFGFNAEAEARPAGSYSVAGMVA